MKKFLSLFLVIFVAISQIGCGGGVKVTSSVANSTSDSNWNDDKTSGYTIKKGTININGKDYTTYAYYASSDKFNEDKALERKNYDIGISLNTTDGDYILYTTAISSTDEFDKIRDVLQENTKNTNNPEDLITEYENIMTDYIKNGDIQVSNTSYESSTESNWDPEGKSGYTIKKDKVSVDGKDYSTYAYFASDDKYDEKLALDRKNYDIGISYNTSTDDYYIHSKVLASEDELKEIQTKLIDSMNGEINAEKFIDNYFSLVRDYLKNK